jgi:hypothetical protein
MNRRHVYAPSFRSNLGRSFVEKFASQEAARAGGMPVVAK